MVAADAIMNEKSRFILMKEEINEKVMFEKELEKNVRLLTLVSGGQPRESRPPKSMRQS